MKTCPICKSATAHRYRPFCSKRCADVDLGRWMTGRYAIPAEEEDDAEVVESVEGAGESGTDQRH